MLAANSARNELGRISGQGIRDVELNAVRMIDVQLGSEKKTAPVGEWLPDSSAANVGGTWLNIIRPVPTNPCQIFVPLLGLFMRLDMGFPRVQIFGNIKTSVHPGICVVVGNTMLGRDDPLCHVVEGCAAFDPYKFNSVVEVIQNEPNDGLEEQDC